MTLEFSVILSTYLPTYSTRSYRYLLVTLLWQSRRCMIAVPLNRNTSYLTVLYLSDTMLLF